MTNVLRELLYGMDLARGMDQPNPCTPDEFEKFKAEQEAREREYEKRRHKETVLALAEELLFLPSELEFQDCLAMAESIIRQAKEYIEKD